MIETFASPEALALAAAAGIEEALRDALANRGRASLVATGGRSPGPVYDLLAKADLDWTRVLVTLSDERQVPPDSPDANTRLVRERLLVGRAARAHFIPLDPFAEDTLRALAPFDAVMLGMGEDGHIASLIPGSSTLEAGMAPGGSQMLLDTPAGVGSPPLARITLTFAALIRARAIFLLIAGEAKRKVIEDGAGLPAHALLAQGQAPVRVFWAPTQ